jgi:organic radical activating enzyme
MLLPVLTDKLHCWAWNRVYVKSNGRIPCWCDAGEIKTIWQKDFGSNDFILDLVNGPEMRNMRLKILKDQQYYVKECGQCCCLIEEGRGSHWRYPDGKRNANIANMNKVALTHLNQVSTIRKWQFGSIDKIAGIQLEPSFPCNLRCPGCLHGWHDDPMSTETGPFIFPYEWFTKMIDSITQNNVTLKRITYVGRGEPTLNKKFPQMINYARHKIPNIIMSMDTNSNQPFKKEYLGLDWINCSIDGSTPEAYSTYRRRGKFEPAIKFMQDAVEARNTFGSNCRIRWKYILFDTTESDELLNLAQNMARTIGIDQLDFVITTVGGYDGTIAPATRFKTMADFQFYLDASPIFPGAMVSRS